METMKKLKTSRFGEIEFEQQDVYAFPSGIPGFAELTQYLVLQPDPEFPFFFLQSIEEEEVGFIMTNPFLFHPTYDFILDDSTKEELDIEKATEVQVYGIVSIKESMEDASINLLAPIVINPNVHKGKQTILHGTAYQTKHPLKSELTSQTEANLKE